MVKKKQQKSTKHVQGNPNYTIQRKVKKAGKDQNPVLKIALEQ